MRKVLCAAVVCGMVIVGSVYGQQRGKGGDQQAVNQLTVAASRLSPQGQLALVNAIVQNMRFYVAKPDTSGKVHVPTCQHANIDGRSIAFVNEQAVLQARRDFCGVCCKGLVMQQKAQASRR